MNRLLVVALLATASAAALTGAAHAQSRPMPAYDEQQTRPSPDGSYEDSYSSEDTRNQDRDQRDTPPPSSRWATPAPYARADQVDQGRPDDSAHRADRAYTADLNRRRWAGRNAPPPPAGSYSQSSAAYRAELAEHDRAMQQYRAAQDRYAERITRWRARADACEAGDRAA